MDELAFQLLTAEADPLRGWNARLERGATTQQGELLLFDTRASDGAPLARLQLFEGEAGVYSHPALVGERLYVRGSAEICRIDLAR